MTLAHMYLNARVWTGTDRPTASILSPSTLKRAAVLGTLVRQSLARDVLVRVAEHGIVRPGVDADRPLHRVEDTGGLRQTHI